VQRSKEFYALEYEEMEKSVCQIAEEQGTYPNKIRRELKHLGFRLRDKGESMAAAIRTGRLQHPTKGKTRSETTRQKIRESLLRKTDAPSSEEEDGGRGDRPSED
jgi:hypothetical protein